MPRLALAFLTLTVAAVVAPSARCDDAPAAIDAQDRQFWSFRSLSRPPVPEVEGASAARTTVDAFVVRRLQEKGLDLSPEADRLTLLRRASFDLVGLPPSPEEMEASLADQRSDAYERMVDRLLASPHFGERWGRHWLDAAGYSDITGGDNDAGIIKLSEGKWKYRDYVVDAYNRDLPYEQFVTEQLAGDELVDWRSADEFTPRTSRLLVATGFLRNAADDTDEKELTTPDILNGVLQRTSEVVANNLLGLTMGCAKCHDHKYEPIPQHDYYGFLAAFTPVFNPDAWVPPKQRALADISPRQKAEAEKHNAEIDRQVGELRAQIAEVRNRHRQRLFDGKLAAVPEPIRADVKAALETEAGKRSEVQKYLAEKFQPSVGVSEAEIEAALDQPERSQAANLHRRIAQLEETRRQWGTIQAAYDVGPPPVTHLLERGNYLTPGEAVEPGFLSVLCAPEVVPASYSGAASQPADAPLGSTSGRRLALARWITDWHSPSGGLAARVYVNRVWQHLFGRGIVETSENLGVSGAEPTHPELLEHLASEFVAGGRQTKTLIRQIVTSAVYRQASTRFEPASQSAGGVPSTAASEQAAATDPGNALLSRMPLRRLEAEIVRDAILATSGQLDRKLGGPSLPVETQPDGSVVIQEKALPAGTTKGRRSLYVLARRNYHLSMLNVFDQPAMSTNCPNRQQSAVVTQSLTMLNDAFVLEQAGHFARRVRASATDDNPQTAIALAFRIALAREPSPRELDWSSQLLADHVAEYRAANLPDAEAAEKSLEHLCHMLLNSNEFLYVP